MKNVPKICLVLAVITSVFVLGCAQNTTKTNLNTMNVKEILKKLSDSYNSTKNIKGNVEIIHTQNGLKNVEKMQFALKKPDKYWYNSDNYTIVRNGNVTWFYNKKMRIVIETTNSPKFDYGNGFATVKSILKNNSVKLLGTETIFGKKCYVIEEIPKNNSTFIRKMWIAEEYWYPIKVEISGSNVTTILEYTNLKFNTNISNSLFEFKPPAGVKIEKIRTVIGEHPNYLSKIQNKINFKILVPTYTAGYKLCAVQTTNNSAVYLLYKKGNQSMAISEMKTSQPFEFSKIQNPPPKYPQMQNQQSIVKYDGVTFEVLGNSNASIVMFSVKNVNIIITAPLQKNETLKVGESMLS